MILAYGSVRWWKIFSPDQCSGINRFVAIFAVPLLSFHFISTNNPSSFWSSAALPLLLRGLRLGLELLGPSRLLAQRGRRIDWFSVDPSSDRCRRRSKNPPPDTHLSPFSGTFTTDLLSTAVAVGPTIVSLGGSGKGDQCSVVLPDVHAFDTHRPDRDWF
ncbi:hypothetical protein RJ640_012319 [Escallonia rubra]|uniref:Uncharacterized protein n=1 Tax=Escallonia rubra TaxID=112253 RepID=A0AA88UQU1_9ASTE|nr:hypothetical protein RJ640_012319 [Escallonia rubra]